MRRSGIDMWVIVSREYNEDPVLKTFLPSTWHSARRNTMLVIYDPGAGKKLETYAMARYAVGKMFKKAWDADKQPDQWKALAMALIALKNPKRIGVNKSKDFRARRRGISAAHYDQLMGSAAHEFENARHGRGQSGDRLARNAHARRDGGLPEHRADGETDHCRRLFRKGHPARRNDDRGDVVWWYRERIKDLKLDTWFHPSVSVQRKDPESFEHLRAFSDRPEDQVILPGDLHSRRFSASRICV